MTVRVSNLTENRLDLIDDKDIDIDLLIHSWYWIDLTSYDVTLIEIYRSLYVLVRY